MIEASNDDIVSDKTVDIASGLGDEFELRRLDKEERIFEGRVATV